MKIYQVKTKRGKKFWTFQLPFEEVDNEEVVGEAILTEDLLKDVSEEDKNFLILELAQTVRFNNVEEKIETEKNRVKRKARKTLK